MSSSSASTRGAQKLSSTLSLSVSLSLCLSLSLCVSLCLSLSASLALPLSVRVCARPCRYVLDSISHRDMMVAARDFGIRFALDTPHMIRQAELVVLVVFMFFLSLLRGIIVEVSNCFAVHFDFVYVIGSCAFFGLSCSSFLAR